MEKTNQRIIVTKRMLKEGLLRLLEKDNAHIDKITVSDLCKESGINRGTFYNHYSIPKDVLVEMVNDAVEEINALCPTPTTAEEAEKYLEIICTYLKNNWKELRLIIECPPDMIYTDYSKELISQTYKIWQNTLSINALDDESLKLLGTFSFYGCSAMVKQWLLNEIDKTPQEIASLIFDAFFKNKLS